MSKNNRVRIFVRTRPTPNFAHGMIDFLQDGKTIKVHTQRDEKEKIVDNQLLDWSFKVDGILHNANQDQVYDEVASKMVTRSLNGYNGTLMAYGQTGAGKTFTITGATENFKQRGIIPRAISQVFKEIEEQVDNVVTVRISYLEIYNENMFDLLSTLPASGSSAYYDIQSMTIVEGDNGSVSVKGLSLHAANNEGEALNLLFEGETNRVIAAHSLNKNSSRSHCIFTIHIESRSRTQSSAKYVASKLNLVDLAGSERIGKTGSQGQILREAMYINKSLSFLEQTVIALADKNRDHVPFRQTKLTHALKDSLGGKCMTSMVANIYGEADQLEETISTLRFAMRMKRVAVEPAINDHYDPWILIKELKGEISHLKQELSMHNTLANHAQVQYDPLTEGQINYIRKQVKTFLEGKAAEIDVSNLRQINTVFAQFRSVVLSMEEATHTKVRQKYVLIDKNNADAMAAIQRSGIPLDEDGNYINMVDSSIGSLGVAASTAGVTTAPSKAKTTSNQNQQQSTAAAVTAAKRKSGKKSRAGGSPTGRGVSSPAPQSEVKGGKLAPSAVADTESVKKEGSLASADSHTDDKKMSRPSTPPTRAQAFEEFKNEKGQEISRILSENKSILQSKKRMVKDIAHAVNATKQMIDGTRISLEEKRRERIEQGEFVNEDGETVIDEEEFLLISELKKLKQQYRIDYEEMRNVKSEVEYCQKLVDQCRQRLVQEFDAWYSENFLGEPVIASASVGFGIRPGVHPPARLQLTTRQANIEDEQEKFDRLQQQVLLENPDSAAFYNAKLNMHRRHLNEKSYSQGQPHPGEHAIGIPNASMRSRLPNQFSMVNVPTY
ncbi:kinesin-like protein KIF9 [Styela clava]